MQKVISFRDAGGELYDIPEDEAEAFLADRPEARPVRVFRDASGALYDIPEEESEAFQAEMPQAEPVRSVRTQDGEVFDVPESERATFLKGYRTEPEFQADREAVRGRARAAAGPDESVAGAAARGAVEGFGRGLAAGAMELGGVIAEGTAGAIMRPAARLLGAAGVPGMENYIAESKRQEAELRARAEEMRGSDQPPESVLDQMNRGWGAGGVRQAGGLLTGIGLLGAAAPTLGAATLPALGAVQAYGQGGGPKEMLEGAVGGAARQVVLGGAQVLPPVGAAAAGAGGFAAIGALEGERGEELMIDALMGGAFAAQASLPTATRAGGSAARARETLREAVRPLVQSNWWRNLTVQERGLVLRSAEAGQSAATLRSMGAPEALARQVEGRLTEAQRIRAGLRQGDRAAFEAARKSRMTGEATAAPPSGQSAVGSGQSEVGGGQSPTLPNSPLPNSPLPTPAFAPEIAVRVPVLDTSPLPPSPFAAPPAPQPGPTLKAAETLMVNRQVVEGWEAAKQRRDQEMAQQAADAKTAAVEQSQAVRAGTAESKAARARRLSLDSFWEQHHGTFGGLPMIERILAGQVFRAPTKRSGGEYDAWKALIEKYPELGMMMSRKGAGDGKGVPIDVAAIEEKTTPDKMVAEIEREWSEYQAWKARDGRTQEELRSQEVADQAQDNLTTPAEVTPAQLKAGDMVRTPDGQWRRVEREPDTVILADGTDIALPEESAEKLALQAHVPADQPGIDEARQAYTEQERAMWAEAERERIAAEQDAPTAPQPDSGQLAVGSGQSPALATPALATPELPDLALQGQTQEQMDAEAAARQTEAQRQEMLARAAAPLAGNAGDQTAVIPGMENEVDVNLFDAADIEARLALGMEPAVPGGQSAVGSGQVAVVGAEGNVPVETAVPGGTPPAQAPLAKPPELMTPEEAGVTPSEPPAYPPRSEKQRFGPKGYANATPEQIAQHKAELKAYRQAGQRAKERTANSNAHWNAVDAAARDGKPINAESFEWRYPSEKPEGYVREGDRYVFKGAEPVSPSPASRLPSPSTTAPAAQPADFALTARRMTDGGSVRGPKGTEWNVRGNQVEVAHAVTGREMGTIDLDTGAVTPRQPQDEAVVREIAGAIAQQSETYAKAAELERLKQYPFRNAARIQELEQSATPPPAQDIRGTAQEQGRSGSVNLPQALSPRAQRGIRRVAALFSQTQGVGEQAYEMVNQMRRSLEAARLSGREARNRLYGIADELSAAHGRPAVLEAIGDVQTGRATPADFSARFGLAPGNEMERFLNAMVRDTDANSKRILKWVGNNREMRRHADEARLYQTRAYLLHALGEDYVPPDTARRAAVLEVEAGLADAVDRLARQATAVRGRRPGRRIDVINWLDTGDETFLRTASRTRAEAARQLRRNWLELRQVIDGLAIAGDDVTATMNAEAAGRAADGIVEFYLQRGAQRGEGATGPGVETGHLRARFLEGAFRQLYGEITDPAVRQQITTEVQGRMLAEMTLFERIFAECEGSVWARYPDPQRGIMERLGDADNVQDRRRYGDMAGRYVTKEFRDLMDTAQHKGSVYQTMQSLYFGPMALQRMGKLLSPKTISRNYITAVTGLALETGDVFLPGYWGDWAEGHRLAVDYARGRPEAIARIRELVELGVFQPGASSYTADMQAALGKSGKRMQKAFKGVTEAYTFIDFPTKYAAFMARQRAGMTGQQAAQHVRDMYQNRERVPPIVGKVSRIGLADYLSYQYDSVRMALNSMRFATDEARKGHVLPLFGWIAARAIFALTSVQATKMLSEAAGKFYEQVRQALRGIGDDDDDKHKKSRPGITPLEDGQLSRMRDLVAPYDQNAPMLAWREERGGRLERIGYTIAGGQTAFPMDDIITGALQSPQHGQGFLEAVGKSALQILDEGMYVDAAAKAIGGQGFDGRRTPTGKGLWHARPGQEDPERGQIVSDAIKGWIADMAPAYPAQMFAQLMRREENERAGVRDQGIFARETLSTAEIVARQHRLVRAYTMTRSEMNAQIRNKIMPQKEALERTRQIINQAAGMKIEKGAARPGLDKQAAHAQESRARYLGAIARTLQSARSVAPEWYDGASMVRVLTESGLSRDEAIRAIGIANGVAIDTDYRPNPTISPMQTGLYQRLTNPSR